jgi:hypothetical protein
VGGFSTAAGKRYRKVRPAAQLTAEELPHGA